MCDSVQTSSTPTFGEVVTEQVLSLCGMCNNIMQYERSTECYSCVPQLDLFIQDLPVTMKMFARTDRNVKEVVGFTS